MKYVRIQNVADFFDVSVPTVRAWMKSGKIPRNTYMNVSGSYRFDLNAVEKALRSVDNDNVSEEEFDTPEDTGTVDNPVEQIVALWDANEDIPDEDL